MTMAHPFGEFSEFGEFDGDTGIGSHRQQLLGLGSRAHRSKHAHPLLSKVDRGRATNP